MVSVRISNNTRLALLIVSPKQFDFLNCEVYQDLKVFQTPVQDIQTLRHSNTIIILQRRDFVSLTKSWDSNTALWKKKRDCKTHMTAAIKNKTARPVKFLEHFARPIVFEESFASRPCHPLCVPQVSTHLYSETGSNSTQWLPQELQVCC